MTNLILVGDQTSPFSQRTLFALELKQIHYQYQEASDSQKALDSSATNPTEYLPFLIYHHQIVNGGSVNLIQFIEEAFPDHSPNLLSPDLIQRSRQRLWSDYIRQFIVPLFLKSLRSKRVDHQTRSDTLTLAHTLDTYADACIGPYFSGQTISLPDILIAPFILAAHPHSVDSCANQRYHSYAKAILSHPTLKRALPHTLPGSSENTTLQQIPCYCDPTSSLARLPPEILTIIINKLGDYELAQTLGIPHDLSETPPWKESATPLDRAILSGRLSIVKRAYEEESHTIFTQWGARVMVRFGYTTILDYLLRVEPALLHRICDYLLPEVASGFGRVDVLEWARSGEFKLPRHLNEVPMDEASRNGYVSVLEWWKRSGYNLVYSEASLNSATKQSQLDVLEWWKNSGLELKIGNVLDFASMASETNGLDWWSRSGLGVGRGKYGRVALYHASCHGNLKVLDWWRDSPLELVYDKDVLVGATKHGRIEVLEWWRKSGIPVYYTFFDIEEAIEDCVEGQSMVKKWWAKRGLDGEGSASGWTTTRLLGKT